MAIVLNWRRIRTHSVRRHALRIVDVRHIVAFHMHRFLPLINVCAHDTIVVQNIRPHHRDIQEENVDRPMGRWPMPDAMVLDIMLAPSSFAIVEIVPG